MADPYGDGAVLAAIDTCFEAHGLRNAVLEAKARLAALASESFAEPHRRDTELVAVLGQLDFVADVLGDMAAAMPPDVARALSDNDAAALPRVGHPARGVLANMHGALEARERLGVAKGVAMHATGCDADGAFRLLQHIARRRGARLNVVVDDVAARGSLGADPDTVVDIVVDTAASS